MFHSVLNKIQEYWNFWKYGQQVQNSFTCSNSNDCFFLQILNSNQMHVRFVNSYTAVISRQLYDDIIVLQPDVHNSQSHQTQTHFLPHNSYQYLYLATLLSNQQISWSSLLDLRDLAPSWFQFSYFYHSLEFITSNYCSLTVPVWKSRGKMGMALVKMSNSSQNLKWWDLGVLV